MNRRWQISQTGERMEVTNLAVYDERPMILRSLEALDQLDTIRRALDKLVEAQR